MVVVPYSPGEGHKIKVFDFMNTKMSTHEATTVFEKPTIFKEPVITGLPFTEYSRTAPIGFYAGEFFIMDDWRLVAVKVFFFLLPPFYQLLTFPVYLAHGREIYFCPLVDPLRLGVEVKGIIIDLACHYGQLPDTNLKSTPCCFPGLI